MRSVQRLLFIGAICLAVAVPVMTRGDDDNDDDDGDCNQTAGTSSTELLSVGFYCYPQDGIELDIEATGDIGNFGEAGARGPIASCQDLIGSALAATEGCVAAGQFEELYGNGTLRGSILCTGERNQVVSDLATFLLGLQPAQPVSVISQPAVPAAPRVR